VTHQNNPIGYIFFSDIPSYKYKIKELHVCCDLKYKGRWVTKKVLNKIYFWLNSNDIDMVYANIQQKGTKNFVKRLGFEVFDKLAVLKRGDNKWEIR
jgi:hypothetical protein